MLLLLLPCSFLYVCLPLQFHKLAELEQTEPGKILDVIGVVERVDSWGIINKKDGTETRKRAIVLRDDSGRSVEVGWVGGHCDVAPYRECHAVCCVGMPVLQPALKLWVQQANKVNCVYKRESEERCKRVRARGME